MPKTQYLEAHQTQQLLRLLDNSDGLELPVCIEHRDKPDFILSTRSRRIGLETTSFTDEEAMRADHLLKTRFPDVCVTPTGLRDGPRRRTNQEIASTMLSYDTPWECVLDGAEHVANKICECIRNKRQKFQSPSFAKFDENWLLLTDHLNHFSSSTTDELLARHLLASSSTFGTEFDRIYILYGPRCFRIQGGQLATKLSREQA